MEPVRLLRDQGTNPDIYYANSNIHPPEEYRKRLDTLREWADSQDLRVVEGPYRPDRWEAGPGTLGAAENDEQRQERCRLCYRQRFEEAAEYARAHGYGRLGTTLSVSPYQYTEILREELEAAAQAAGLEPYFQDYRPYYDNATRRSREAGMYRQNYCGCRISMAEAAAEREERRIARKQAKQREQELHRQERLEEEQARLAKRAERQAYDAKQQRKREILRALRQQSKQDHDLHESR